MDFIIPSFYYFKAIFFHWFNDCDADFISYSKLGMAFKPWC